MSAVGVSMADTLRHRGPDDEGVWSDASAGIVVEPNAGSFQFFSQECIRFVRTSRPFRLPMLWLLECLWLPFWLVLAPLLGLVLPAACRVLDGYDREHRFRVGYHVRAVRSARSSS